jgi:NAD(P)-dependent dehydrogenase (short-subunit alcohol dehydrogenase family)/rhamnose utilization protein RhaD (predicted bifunctional aldolase and dehydrogenase)
MSLDSITKLSNKYGSDSRFVLAGGGNTSFKDEEFLYVKPSGVTLADIEECHFVKMERKKIRDVFNLPSEEDSSKREATVKKMMADAVSFDSTGRPSVEAPLHEALPYKFVVHLHPALVNGMTCGQNGAAICSELFQDALWVEYVDPGFVLAKHVNDQIKKFVDEKGKTPQIVVLQNHGVFVGADSEEGIDKIYAEIMDKLESRCKEASASLELETGTKDAEAVFEYAPGLRSILGDGESRMAIASLAPFKVAEGPLTPDHIVYSKSFALISDNPDKEAIQAFEKENGYKPLVISIPGKAVFCAGKTYKDALTTAALAKDAALVQQLTAAFGGTNFISKSHRQFIENWEVESYRKKVASSGASGRLEGKIAVVTGGAQGFGYGIAQCLAGEGATVAIADLNIDGAQTAAEKLCGEFGKNKSFALAVNIADEDSVAAMVGKLLETCGGADLFVANAGVLKAGSVKTLAKKDWDFVTNVNYTGYFLCAKHIAQVMAKQNAQGGDWTDIVQVNSKSGLAGSNKNGAYAGSKFGTIGLTQSFAMELVEDKIKVNSVCPGNFFEGPLWSDPDRGLFVQYLNSGKVPGAQTIEDVKKFYESKIPMNRGCSPVDVAKAIIYAVEQKYETGQAIPVTGGQVMLN